MPLLICAAAEELSTLMQIKEKSLVVIDVRDADFNGGRTNSPLAAAIASLSCSLQISLGLFMCRMVSSTPRQLSSLRSMHNVRLAPGVVARV
jgi:hypothetical protein